eukprot:2614119-Karenia_brevis.AAC.1
MAEKKESADDDRSRWGDDPDNETSIVRHFTDESESSDEETDSREKEEKRNDDLMSRLQGAACERSVVTVSYTHLRAHETLSDL